jgi:hypothetical protein
MADKITEMLILNGERVASEDMKRFWAERPDPDFSPEHNDFVVKNSIAKAEAHRKAMQKLQQEGMAERASALTSYIKHLDHTGKRTTAEEYFGRKELAHLQGKKVMQILKERKANGQDLWQVINTDNKTLGYK